MEENPHLPQLPAPRTHFATVEGHVRTAAGDPMVDVFVDLQVKTPNVPLASIPVSTDEQGYYKSQGLEAAEYEVTVDIPGYQPVTHRITLAPRKDMTLDVVLQPENQ